MRMNGSNRVGLDKRVNWLVDDDIIHDVMARVSTWELAGACERVNEDGGMWERMFNEVEISEPSGGAWLMFWTWNFQVL